MGGGESSCGERGRPGGGDWLRLSRPSCTAGDRDRLDRLTLRERLREAAVGCGGGEPLGVRRASRFGGVRTGEPERRRLRRSLSLRGFSARPLRGDNERERSRRRGIDPERERRCLSSDGERDRRRTRRGLRSGERDLRTNDAVRGELRV